MKWLGKFSLLVGMLSVFAVGSVKVQAATNEMYRMYNPNSGEHFYTATAAEKNHLVNVGWKSEGIGWTAPTTGAPVYRLYNPNAGDHHYTLNLAEKNMLTHVGWKFEGIGWYSDTKKAVPLYRAYNPNAKAGSHNYTVNYNEEQNLTNHGWRNEGISWYGTTKSNPSTPTTPTKQSYTVTVKHVDRQTGKVITSSNATVKAGQTYTARAKPFKFVDYGLNWDTQDNFSYQVSGVASQSKKITNNTTINFNYNQVHHVFIRTTDNYTNDYLIKNSYNRTVINVEHGQSTIVKAPTYSGYVLDDRDTPNSSVTLNNVTTNHDIGFGYTHKYNITVNHVDVDTNATLSTETKQVYEGDSFSTPWKNMTAQNYYLCSNDDSSISDDFYTGIRSVTDIKQDKTITFKYKHITLEELNNHIRQDALKVLNEYRQQEGVGTMQFNDIVQKAADIRAQELQTSFSHYRPSGGTFQDVLEGLGCYGGCGENIGTRLSTLIDDLLDYGGEGLIEQFKGDEGHKGNLLYGKQTLAGISASYTVENNGGLSMDTEFIGARPIFK